MASNVLSLGEKQEKKGAQEKVEGFMIRNRKPILCIVGVLVLAAAAVCVFVGVSDSQTKKGIDAVSAIEYQYVKKSDDIADSEVAERQAAALASLASYTEKKGIVGIRANMLAADINFAKKDFAASLDAWLKAAALGEKLYTAPICYFNAGVCAEELEKTAEAIKYYETAANKPDFYLAAHAFFNLGRMNEVAADFEKAKTAYQAVIDKYPGNDFANLAQSRIIALNVSGKAE